MKNYFEDDVLRFLQQSNFIENERSFAALQDAKDAWRFINYFATLDADIIKMVHAVLMRNLWSEIAGKFRNMSVRVGNKLMPPSDMVPHLLDALLTYTPNNEGSIKHWHVRFEGIHPFRDGNGRTGRIIMNWQRITMGLPILVIHEGEEQYEYYKWFAEEAICLDCGQTHNDGHCPAAPL